MVIMQVERLMVSSYNPENKPVHSPKSVMAKNGKNIYTDTHTNFLSLK